MYSLSFQPLTGNLFLAYGNKQNFFIEKLTAKYNLPVAVIFARVVCLNLN